MRRTDEDREGIPGLIPCGGHGSGPKLWDGNAMQVPHRIENSGNQERETLVVQHHKAGHHGNKEAITAGKNR